MAEHAYWVVPLALLCLLSNTTQVQLLRDGTIHRGPELPHQSSIRKCTVGVPTGILMEALSHLSFFLSK